MIFSFSVFADTIKHEVVHIKRGSIGMNLSPVTDWSTAYPFLNFVKHARPFSDGKGGELELDKFGWVKRLKKGQEANLFFLTVDKNRLPYKKYIVRYKGKGKITYKYAAKKIKKIGQNTDLIKVDDSVDGGYAVLTIVKTDPNNYIRDIEVIPEKYISEYNDGEIFNPEYISFLKQFRVLRFMNWMKTNDSKQKKWEDRPVVENYSWSTSWNNKGVPLEILIALANKTGVDPWFNIPHMADDDYVYKFAKLIKDQLNPSLTAYIEYSNEVWNWGFSQAKYTTDAAINKWGKKVVTAGMQWHGMRTAQICDIFKKEVFVSDSNRIHCTLGTQAVWKGLEFYALECPAWVKEGNQPCYKHGIDSLSIGGYFYGCLNGAPEEGREEKTELIRSWFKEKDGGMRKAFEQIESAKHFRCNGMTLDKIGDIYAYHHKVAKEKGLELIVYEGGSHVMSNGYGKVMNDPEFIKFFIAINRHKYMKKLYMKNFESWKSNGGTIFLHFYDIGKPSKWGSWGALEYINQSTTPKMEAIKEFNDKYKCWWKNCEIR